MPILPSSPGLARRRIDRLRRRAPAPTQTARTGSRARAAVAVLRDEAHDSAFRSSAESGPAPAARSGGCAGVRRSGACGCGVPRPFAALESCGRPSTRRTRARACRAPVGTRRGACRQSTLGEQLLGLVDRDARDARLLIHPSVLVQGLVFGLPQRSQDTGSFVTSCGCRAPPKNGEAVVERGIWVAGTASGDIFGSRAAAWLSSTIEQAPDDHGADDRHDGNDRRRTRGSRWTLTSLVSCATPSLCISSGG